MKPRRIHSRSQKPSVAARKARAVTHLLNVRSLEGITAEWAAHQFDLKPAVAEQLLAEERQRRG